MGSLGWSIKKVSEYGQELSESQITVQPMAPWEKDTSTQANKDTHINTGYNNDVLNSVENEKVLGVRIDNNLTWSIHINFIAKKISSNLWLLSKLKDYLSLNTEYNFTKHIFNPTLTIVLQYGEEHLNII